MPRLTVSKVYVLVHANGEVERLDSIRKFEQGCQKFQDHPELYQLEQRDLMELHPD